MVGHWVTLPVPAIEDSDWSAHLALNESDADGLNAFHFLYSDCPCSMRILDDLLKHPSHDSVNETIVVIGDNHRIAESAASLGYRIRYTTTEKLRTDFGVEAAPLLVVIANSNEPKYVGGYTARKQGLAPQHREIISKCYLRENVASLPLYGCAVSSGLKDVVDPMRLKTGLKF